MAPRNTRNLEPAVKMKKTGRVLNPEILPPSKTVPQRPAPAPIVEPPIVPVARGAVLNPEVLPPAAVNIPPLKKVYKPGQFGYAEASGRTLLGYDPAANPMGPKLPKTGMPIGPNLPETGPLVGPNLPETGPFVGPNLPESGPFVGPHPQPRPPAIAGVTGDQTAIKARDYLRGPGGTAGKILHGAGRGLGMVQAALGITDMAQNGVNLTNAIDVGVGGAAALGSATAGIATTQLSAIPLGQQVFTPLVEERQDIKQDKLVNSGGFDPTSPEAQLAAANQIWGHGMFGGNQAFGTGHNFAGRNYINPNGMTLTAAHNYDGVRNTIPAAMETTSPEAPYPQPMKAPAVPNVPAPTTAAATPPPVTPPESPVDVQNGKVVPVDMPMRPNTNRRSYAELLGEVTGGAIPESLEGFMVANALAGRLRQDDNAYVKDQMDLYQANLTAIPQFAEQNRRNRLEGSEVAYNEALTGLHKATAEGQKKTTANMSTKTEAQEEEIAKTAMTNARVMAIEQAKAAGLDANDPNVINSLADAYFMNSMQAYRDSKAGKVAVITPGQEEKKGTWYKGYTDAQEAKAPAVEIRERRK